MAESKFKISAIEEADRGRMFLEEAHNKIDSYTCHTKNNLVDNEVQYMYLRMSALLLMGGLYHVIYLHSG